MAENGKWVWNDDAQDYDWQPPKPRKHCSAASGMRTSAPPSTT